MEMCYDGALVMPSSYAIMDEEEMTYVEGGFRLKTWIGGAVIDSLITCFCGGAAASALGWLMGKGISKVMSLLIKGKSFWCGMLRNVLGNGVASWLSSKLGIVGTVIGFTTVGGTIMNLWDMCDNGRIDGHIYL